MILSSWELWRIHCREPDSIFVYPHNIYKNQDVQELRTGVVCKTARKRRVRLSKNTFSKSTISLSRSPVSQGFCWRTANSMGRRIFDRTSHLLLKA
jgi:hypothetical protein